MGRKEYAQCVGQGLRGKQFSKEERRLEFCILSKLCSGKSKTREEAKFICSQPKAPKPAKARVHSPQSCEKNALELAHCMVDVIDMDKASNINSVETAIVNALIQCGCKNTS